MMTAYETAKAQNKALWIEYYVPGLSTKPSFFYSATPSDLGFGGADVDAVYENTAYLTPNKVHGWDTASTASV